MKPKSRKIIFKSIKKFQNAVKNPEIYLSIQDSKSEEMKQIVKSLYDYSKTLPYDVESNSLPELIVDQMDEEQIWQQLELQNEDILGQNISSVSKLLSIPDEKFVMNYNESKPREAESDDENSNFSSEQLDKLDEKNLGEDPNGDSEGNQTEDDDELLMRTHNKTSIVDDDFFKLEEMNKFLDDEDRMEMKKNKRISEEDDDDGEEDIDLFSNIEEEHDSNEENEAALLKFKDYFVSNDTTDKRMTAKGKRMKIKKKMRDQDLGEEEEDGSDIENDQVGENKESLVHFNTENNEYYSDDNQNAEENEQQPEVESDNEQKSSFEIREKRLQSRIKIMEENALQEKSWQLRGEVDAKKRPMNSLLEEVLDYDAAVRPAPVITEETTMKLEDIIKQRIKNKIYDDVERKVKPVETPYEFRKSLILNQEKSKESLVNIYEKEYIKQAESLSKINDNTIEQTPVLHQQINKLMKSVLSKLDALSNFYYTPKPAAPEFKIITNTSAIVMEDIQPISVSDKTLLAPEEVRGKLKGDLIGKTERTKTDKSRDLRKKKLKQKYIHKKINERTAKDDPNKLFKHDKNKLLDKITKNKNVDKMKISSSNSIKSSKQFFTQLQENVTKSSMVKKKNKNTKPKSAAKFKL